MKYTSVNELSNFEFHDAKFFLDIFDENRLKIKAEFLNIHKDADQNPHQIDMEISVATITFEDFDLISYEPMRKYIEDKNGELYTTDLYIAFMGDSARSNFLKRLEAGSTVFDFAIKEGDVYFIDASDNPPFTVLFKFTKVTIEWDEYKGKAWYASK